MYMWHWNNHRDDYRQGWPLLTAETEVNGDSKSTDERGPFLIGSFGLSSRYKRFYSAKAVLVDPVQKLFPHRTLSLFFSWLVRWACRAGTRDFCSALAALVGPVQILFSSPHTISILCPHRPATWAGSRAGLPVS